MGDELWLPILYQQMAFDFKFKNSIKEYFYKLNLSKIGMESIQISTIFPNGFLSKISKAEESFLESPRQLCHILDQKLKKYIHITEPLKNLLNSANDELLLDFSDNIYIIDFDKEKVYAQAYYNNEYCKVQMIKHCKNDFQLIFEI